MTDEPLLLTPGPLSTSTKTKNAMLRDWGSRDTKFIALTQEITRKLENIAGVDDNSPQYDCVLIQGSGTFAIEATIDTLIPADANTLVLINGAYGHRMKKMCSYLNRECVTYEVAEHEQHRINEIEKIINSNQDLTHVFAVYCETTSGILNPIKEIAELVERRWGKNFSNEIMYVVGDEWHAGNLSYHLSNRPKWFLEINDKLESLNPKGGIIFTGNAEFLKSLLKKECIQFDLVVKY